MQRKPYVAHQVMFDVTVPHGWGHYLKSHYLPLLTDAAIDALVGHAWQKSSAASDRPTRLETDLIFSAGGCAVGPRIRRGGRTR